MRGIIACSLAFVSLLILSGCGTGKYTDIKLVIREMIEVREEFIAEAEKAESAREATALIKSFEDQMKSLASRYYDLEKKCPELLRPQELPLELKELVDRLNQTVERRDDTLTAILMRYPDDPILLKAVSSMGDVYK